MRNHALKFVSIMAGIMLYGLHSHTYAQMFNAVQLHAAPPGRDGGLAGIAALTMPQYQGAKETRKLIVPVLDYQWANGWFAGASNGIGYNFSKNASLDFGARLTADIGRKESRSTALRGMGEIKEKAELGAFFNVNPNHNISLTSSARYGSGGDSKGFVVDLGISLVEMPNAKLRVGAGAGVSLANQNYMQSFFGVTKLQAQRSQHAEFKPKAGLRDTHITAFISYMFNPRSALTLLVSSDRLAGDAKLSPISKTIRSNSGVLALSYHF
jgi:outer membrane scaffolding protein for murein synthesis (MipA/OmpV family)